MANGIARTGSVMRVATSDGAGKLVIPANDSRKGIILTGAVGRTTFVRFGAEQGNLQGIILSDGNQQLSLTDEWYGDAVRDQITLKDSASVAQTYAWVEFLYLA